MAGALGVGVRVFIGYAPDRFLEQHGQNDPRLKRGTVIGGPYCTPFSVRMHSTGEVVEVVDRKGGAVPHWQVRTDDGADPIVSECFLFPIDGDDPVEVDEDVERSVEVVA